jgi:uroporphyrin-III C-methyltransferase/precorrin-2 dehydrogenase/sirohydrochlorin ferrochelatase
LFLNIFFVLLTLDRHRTMLFPVFLDLKGRPAAVVGDTDAALRKVHLLLRADAAITLFAPEADGEMRRLAAEGRLSLFERLPGDGALSAFALVIVATGEGAADGRIAAAARAGGVPVNVVDGPALSTFVMPAIVDRDPIVVAVSSAGTAPVLARQVRARIEAMLPAGLGRLARFAEGFRRTVGLVVPDGRLRRRFWERFFAGPIAARIVAGDERRAREDMLTLLNRRPGHDEGSGFVQIVGAGPGDPDLLTLKAVQALQQADVILFDHLIGDRVLEYARRDAERIFVGKSPGSHALSQDEINDLMVRLARAGRRVVRLKGGDPFIFGRGGEERAHLLREGIDVEVIPGITAATGCAAASGIPLTLRDQAQAVTLITGHGAEGEPDVDWAALARLRQSIVVYMGLEAAPRIAQRLIDHGLDPSTPTAVIARGTLPQQRIEGARLADLPRIVAGIGPGPALIVIGEVVRQAEFWAEPTVELSAAG